MANSYKHRSGDRKDGRLLRSLPAYNKFLPYMITDKDEACDFYDESFDIGEADKCLRQERVSGYKNISFLHFIIAAYVRCVSMLPGINRFIVGRRIFARDGIDVILTVKRSAAIESSDTQIKVRFEPTDTIFDVYRKINEKTDELKAEDVSGSAEELMETFSRSPRGFLRFGMAALRLMDYFGWLPQSLLDMSMLHGSLLINDAGALQAKPVFHQISKAGTLPLYISFGQKRHAYELDRHGEVTDTRYLDCRFVFDSRIADAHYYSQFLQAMRYIFAHPEILEHSPTRVIEDVG